MPTKKKYFKLAAIFMLVFCYVNYMGQEKAKDSIKLSQEVLSASEKEDDIVDKQREYDFLQQQERKLHEAELNTERTVRNFVLVLMLILLILILYMYRNYRIHRNYNRLLKSKSDIIYSQNMQLKGMDEFKQSMIDMIVHDLKNPLNRILNLPEGGNTDKTIRTVKNTSRHMLNLVLNVLDTSKSEEREFKLTVQKYNISSILKSSIDQVKFLLDEKQNNLNLKIEQDIPVHCDFEIIERVVVNLLTNAIKYSPVGADIVVTAEVESNKLFVKVKDSGPGISEDLKSLIFQKYGQVIVRKSGSARSTGLGLAYCKMAVDAHNGEIDFSSSTQNGTTFWFSLPVESLNELDLDKFEDSFEYSTSLEVLSEKTIKLLKPAVKELRSFEIFEVSELRKVLNRLTKENEQVVAWKEKIMKAILSGNKEEFNKLLDLK